MLVVAGFMMFQSLRLILIVFAIMPVILYATRLFQRAMKAAFEEVRREVANLNSFVQERITGMKIVQLFTREEEEFDTFDEINKKHKRAWIKTVWYNSIYFPIAELSASVDLWLVVWYGGLNALGVGVVIICIMIGFIYLVSVESRGV